jgi:methylmalonyl-CoA/ethylmalonyl-CoA epimerase
MAGDEENSSNRAGVLALDHVAFGVASIADVCATMATSLGGKPHHSGPGIEFRGAQWELAGGARVEAIEPTGGSDGFLHRFLAAGGPRVHHLTFKVGDIRRAASAAEEMGYRVVGYSEVFASWKEMFLHPKEAQGVVVQLAESHPELEDDGWSASWPFPHFEVVAGSRPRVLGLRLSARSKERAIRQWCELLGGIPGARGNVVAIRWHDSPLRLSIHVDADADEGPLGLEIERDRGTALPTPRLADLGCDLLPVDA